LSELTYSIISENVHKILLAEERTIIHALMLILTRMKIVVEPSAVLPLAVILENPEIFRDKNIAIILSGGNLDFSQISNYQKLLD
jgi:threonine dehydratase